MRAITRAGEQNNENGRFSVHTVFGIIQRWIRERKVGSITVNFFKGGISSVQLNETIKVDQGGRQGRVDGQVPHVEVTA